MAIARTRVDHEREAAREAGGAPAVDGQRPARIRRDDKPWAAESAAARQTRPRRRAILRGYTRRRPPAQLKAPARKSRLAALIFDG